MRQPQATCSGAVCCDGSFHRRWIVRVLAVVLFVYSLFLGGCGQPPQPKEGQSGHEDSAVQQQTQGKIANLKQGTYTLDELPPPEPVSEVAGLQNVDVGSKGDMYAHPPSGATFTIENKRRPVSLTFTPSFLSNVPVEKTDGVTFEVWSGKERLYQKHVLPDDSVSQVALNLPRATTEDQVQLSFVTRVGPAGNRDYDWALWRDVRIVIGEG